jgi:hypothetical protein
VAAAHQLAEQDVVGQRLLDVLLDDPGQGAGAVELVEAVLGQPVGGVVAGSMVTFRSASWASSCMTNFCTTWRMISGVSGLKATTASRRLRNSGVNRRLSAASSSPSTLTAAEADRLALGVGGPGVGGHDQDHVAEVDLLAVESVSTPWSMTWSRML